MGWSKQQTEAVKALIFGTFNELRLMASKGAQSIIAYQVVEKRVLLGQDGKPVALPGV